MRLSSTIFTGAVMLSLASLPAYSAGNHPVTGEPLAEDQTFTYMVLDKFPSIDPQIIEDVEGSSVARDLFEGLLNQDADGNLIPGVATQWSSSEDKKTWTFKLRDNAKWSNGDPVVAGDFVYAWQRAADPETASPYAWFMELTTIKNASEIIAGDVAPTEMGVSAPDDLTLVVELTDSLPYFDQMMTHATLFPTHQATIEAHGADWTKPGNLVGNGAYVLTEWVPGERLVRERNPMYWDNENTILDKSIALVINDENIGLTRYLAGELDRTLMPAGQYPKMKEQYPDEAVSFPRLCNYYYTFNLSDTGPEAFKDVRVRQALALAVDRQIISEKVLAGGQPEAYTFTPAAVAGFDVPGTEMASMSQADRDAKAKALMEEAGYGADNPLVFDMLYNTSENHKKVAIAMSQMWKQKLGVEATLANQEWKTFLETRGNQDFQLARGAWCGDYNEASTFLDLLTSASGYNDGKFSNPMVDELMLDARTAADAAANYTKVEEILAEEMPVIPVYHYAGVYMHDTDLGGWPVQNVEQNWYSRDLYKIAE
jgi:oligopeptide transport system substrate-binding protein